jgi:LCP family protein required for cell wall assembly
VDEDEKVEGPAPTPHPGERSSDPEAAADAKAETTPSRDTDAETDSAGVDSGPDAEPATDAKPDSPAAQPVASAETRPVKRKRRTARTAGKVALSLLSVVALAATGYGFLTYHRVETDVHTSDVLDLPEDAQAPPPDDGAEDILLVGTDARTDMRGNPLPPAVLKQLRTEQTSGLNTDTLIILRIPDNGGQPTATSIPRDTWVDVPQQAGQAKINSVYATAKEVAAGQLRGKEDPAAVERDSDQAGRKALVQTVQDFTQVRIDHYAEVNLFGFYLITEALGGVEVCLNHATEDKDSGANFRAGPQTISGGDALSFVRQRKNLPRGDLDRIVRQQAFLSSALRKVLTAGTLTNPSTMSSLTDALSRSLVFDPGFDILQLAQKAKGLATGEVTFGTIPVITINGRSPDGKQSIVQVDPNAVHQFFAGLAGRSTPSPSTPSPSATTSAGGVAPAAYTVPLRQNSIDGVECVN